MSPGLGDRAEEIFDRAAGLTGDAQQRFLDERCGSDADLRTRLEILLRNDREMRSGFLEGKPWLSLPEEGSRSGAESASTGLPSPIVALENREIGPYRIERELGRGGQAIVYLAEDTRLHRKVALKVLTGMGPGSEDALCRFRREAEVASKLDHPGICTVFEAGVESNVPHIAMRFVDGESLARKIATARSTGPDSITSRTTSSEVGAGAKTPDPPSHPTGPITNREVRSTLLLIEKTARALHVAHEAGIIHRDIKPGNIMVTPGGEPVILDFGLARELAGEGPSLTITGDVFGTPAYMSPEQLLASRVPLDRRSDVYSLGATLYECLTWHAPFDTPTRHALFQAIQTRDPPDPRRLNPAISNDLKVVLDTALEKDRDYRYQTAQAFAEDLRRVREREPILAKPVPARIKLLRWAQRHPGLAVASSVAFVFLSVGLATTLVEKANADASAEEARRQTADARANLEDWNRLADRVRLDARRHEADDDLWPAVPEKVPAMEAWLRSSGELVSRLPDHRAALDRLRSHANPNSEGVFDDARLQIQHDTLREVVRGLTALAGAADPKQITIAEMEERLKFARNLRERTVGDHAALWKETIEHIARNPKYGGLKISEQVGLIPLGRDSESGLEEFCETATGEKPDRGPDVRLRIGENSALVFVLLPGGTFTMGAQSEDPEGTNYDMNASAPDDLPHEVTLAAFFLSKYEMTQGQWLRVTHSNPSYYRPDSDWRTTLRYPAEQVSWDDCSRVMTRLGLQFPTEAQWEYGCRAGTATVYSTGNDIPSIRGFANIADEGSRGHHQRGWQFEPRFSDGYPVTAPVGSFKPNGFGLYDIHGNVWEWCEDSYDPEGECKHRVGDGLRVGSSRERMFRGGSFDNSADGTRSAVRNRNDPLIRHHVIGLRPARRLAP